MCNKLLLTKFIKVQKLFCCLDRPDVNLMNNDIRPIPNIILKKNLINITAGNSTPNRASL